MKRKLMAGTGWKMNHTVAQAREYVEMLLPLMKDVPFDKMDVFVLPPFTALTAVEPLLKDSPAGFGGQNMHWEVTGAWTGEVSAPMLAEVGCTYVELGHSERRYYFNETDEYVNLKVLAALKYNLQPIICIGETQEEKAAGRMEEVLRKQVQVSLQGVAPAQVPSVILGYEPRWAIGQKEAASPEYAQEVHAFIRQCLMEWYGVEIAEQTRVIYGGSVNQENGIPLIAKPDIDGLFIGRAAWAAQGFAQMVKIVADSATQKGVHE